MINIIRKLLCKDLIKENAELKQRSFDNISRIQKTSLSPDDVIIISTDEHFTEDGFKAMSLAMENVFKKILKNKMLLLEGG